VPPAKPVVAVAREEEETLRASRFDCVLALPRSIREQDSATDVLTSQSTCLATATS
jgi:hypothetical protein